MNLFYRFVFNFDRSFSGKARKQLLWLLAGVGGLFIIFYITSFLLGLEVSDFAFNDGNPKSENESGRLFVLTNLFLDSGNMVSVPRKIRVFAFIVSFFGIIFFGGILISVVSNVLERRVERYRNGEVYYPMFDHVIVIGFDPVALSLIRQLCATTDSRKYILVQTMQPADDVRRRILTDVSDTDARRIVVLHGRRNAKEDLEKLYLWKASGIYVVGENDETDHDSINVDCMRRIYYVCRKKLHGTAPVSPLPCYVLFENLSSFTPFQATDITRNWRNYLEFHPMNFYDEWAKRIVVDNCYWREDPKELKKAMEIELPRLDREPINADSQKVVHLVIVGMSRMGVALAVQAAHSLHFPNFLKNPELKTHITFIDPFADIEKDYLIGRYAGLFEINPPHIYEENELSSFALHACNYPENFLDVEFSFVKGRIESDAIRKLLASWANDKENQLLSVAICLNLPPAAIAAGLYLPDEIYENNIPVFVRQEESDALLSLLHKDVGDNEYQRYSHVFPIGMMQNCYTINLENRIRAMAINYVYDYYYETGKEPDSLPDFPELKRLWNTLSAAHQWSNLYHAYSINIKAHAFNIDFSKSEKIDGETLESLSIVEHNRWNVEKLLLGYRKPSAKHLKLFEKEPEAKKKYKNEHFVHTAICPFEQLSSDMKYNDTLITRALPMIVRHAKKLTEIQMQMLCEK